MAVAKSNAVINSNLGLYLDRPAIALSPGMLQDGLNFRVKEGQYSNLNLGWEQFSGFTLNGPVTLIDDFFIRGIAAELLILGTPTDLYVYDPSGDGSVTFITPIFDEGTAAASGTAVTGTTTTWNTAGAGGKVAAGDQITFGTAGVVDPAATWFTVQSVTDDTHLVLHTSAGTVGNGPYTIRHLFTGAQSAPWVTDKFTNAAPANEDQWFATNGVDPVVRWNGTDAQVELLTCLNFTCKTLAVYSNMMIYGNLLQSGTLLPTSIINSNAGAPADVFDGLSEQFIVHSGYDEILRLVKIGDNLAIYSGLTVTLAQFQGDPLIFSFRDIIIGKGPIGPGAVARYGDHHEFLGKDSQYTFDGASITKSGLHVFRDVLRQQDPVRVSQTYSIFDEQNGDLLWVVPSTIDPGNGTVTAPPSRAVVEHYLEITQSSALTAAMVPFSFRSYPFISSGAYFRDSGITWDTLTNAWSSYNFRWDDQFFSASFPLILAGDVNGNVWTINTSQDANGAALNSFVHFGRRATSDGKNRGLVSRVYPYVTPFSTPINVTVHLADHAGGNDTINAVFPFDQTLPQGGHFVSAFRRGRYVSLEFGTLGPGEPWQIDGYDMDIKSGGLR